MNQQQRLLLSPEEHERLSLQKCVLSLLYWAEVCNYNPQNGRLVHCLLDEERLYKKKCCHKDVAGILQDGGKKKTTKTEGATERKQVATRM